MDNIFVGKKIAQLRKQKGRTQEDLAAYFNISKQAVSKWENGLSMPDILILPDIAQYFGVAMDYFFDKKSSIESDLPLEKGKILIRANGLYKLYEENNQYTVENLNVDIYDGVSTAVIGPSNCGKTTFLKCVTGLEQVTHGSVTISGTDITKLKEPDLTVFRREKINYIFSENNLIEGINVWDNINLPYKIANKKIARNRLKQLVVKLGLSGIITAMPNKLSSGEQQRVTIARALLGEGYIVFADEPTGALDLKAGNEALELLIICSKEFSTPVVIVTHDVKVATQCEIVHFMDGGRIVRTMDRPTANEISNMMTRLSSHETVNNS